MSLKEMKAVILAGGRGTRLQPFTVSFPKPLMPLGDVPVLEVLLRRLAAHGITDITLSLGHLAELIKAYLEQRPDLTRGLDLHYVFEAEPSGTAGSLARVPDLRSTFLVMNGDLLTDLDFSALVDFHQRSGSVLTIGAHERKTKIDLGVLKLGQDGAVVGYEEKPEFTHHVSMGIYVYEPQVLQYIGPEAYLDFPDLVLRLVAAGESVSAYVTDCTWLDIGRPDDYAAAQDLFAARRGELLGP